MTEATRSEPLDYDEYQRRTYIPALDGIRAVSILLVIAAHMDVVRTADAGLWSWLSGNTGVRIFFVLSGYLITMLALREEARTGALSLAAFCIRRAFRILPAYYFTLLLYVFLIFKTGMGTPRHAQDLAAALPYYFLYANEYAPAAAFYQSWSLAVEEKFYVVWPFLAFVMLRARFAARVAVAGAFAFVAASALPLGDQYRHWGYGDILIGCVLALLLERRQVYGWMRRVGGGRASWFVLAIAIAMQLTFRSAMLVQILYPLMVAAVIASVVVARRPWAGCLQLPAMTYVGQRAYALYLLHVLAIQAVTRILPAGQGAWVGVAAFATSIGAALVIAELLHRGIEIPGMRMGKALSARILRRASGLGPAAPAEETRHDAATHSHRAGDFVATELGPASEHGRRRRV